jgi:hypothetical protein
MDSLRILSKTPPPLLYHYTTQSGLLGILKSKKIWATHTQYLNDQLEFQHAVSIAKQELFNMGLGPPHHDNRDLLEEMKDGIEDIESINVCVCSFSEAGDILSQWRAYGGGSSSFSIGFSGTYLRSVSDSQKFWLAPCVYSEEKQVALMLGLLEEVLTENVKNRVEGKVAHQPLGGNLVAYLNRLAPILKHQSFAEEREWRIISRPLNCTVDRFDYRPGTSMMTPYYRIPLYGEGLPFQIEEIVVGPTPHEAQSLRSLRGLLAKHGLENTRVQKTYAPYRIW